MTHHELRRGGSHGGKRSRRLSTLAMFAALALGSLALAGCGNGEEEMAPMEEPVGEESSAMGQDPSMDSQDPGMEQSQAMDQDPALDQGDASGESDYSMESSSESLEEGDDQSGF
ncbi:hypothetical protein [Halomonas lysinitropha]|uniref:Uncharacterized protein n=1 Tax=Halomonas lysinitropha TaxID=2607506 RepID=A0A5K1I196_9GAMM|nr:hypothetical protein [Halomonas lysinitropha]VVZ95484.1 hypothetical protein HALO32_01555 [Halomonas lysinitropha]